MASALFRVKSFSVSGSDKCACIVTGYRGKVASYKRVVKILNDRGYSVIAYEHSPAVLTKGDPDLLPALVAQICDDFAERAYDFQEIICVGASIGAGLCFAIQRRFPRVRFGIYAGAGVSPPDTVQSAPLFYFVRRKFARAGFGKTELKSAWKDMDILPDNTFAQSPFVMVLGQADKIVTYDKALATLHAWQRQGQAIRIITRSRLGHAGVIRWYKNHFIELLAEAESLAA